MGAFATATVVFKLQGQLLSHGSHVSSCFFPPPCTENKSVSQKKQVGRKVHCSSRNRVPGVRKVCFSHVHVLSGATALLLYPICPNHASSGIHTKFIFYFHSILPICAATPWDMDTTKNNLLKPRGSVAGNEEFLLLIVMISYNSHPHRAGGPGGRRCKEAAGHLCSSIQ